MVTYVFSVLNYIAEIAYIIYARDNIVLEEKSSMPKFIQTATTATTAAVVSV